MKQYLFSLLVLLLSTVSSFICIPCHAQITTDANNELDNKNSAETTSLNTNERSLVNNTADSANTKPTVISENSGNTAVVSQQKAIAQPKFRIPINSRIFAAPSMRQ